MGESANEAHENAMWFMASGRMVGMLEALVT